MKTNDEADAMNEDPTKQLPGQSDDKLDQLIRMVGNIETRLSNLEQQTGNIETRLGNLEQMVEVRLYDTRPLWEGVNGRLDRLEESMVGVRSDISEIKSTLRSINRQFGVAFSDMAKIRADQDDIEERLEERLSRLDKQSK